ncbi:MAG: tRNA dihydrouridine(20/20a) synthase DusA [Gammaproteobacteria bacterium]|nr:tRNA dihydrouridine(20/20a) synthase DusA [Gammaproteobacteria bacterium]
MTPALDPRQWRLCIAPMMQKTDRHFRHLARLLAPHARLYTEMLTARAILRGDTQALLRHHAIEQPLAVQLGGSAPSELAAAAGLCVAHGYQEVNLNCGCPSDRVQAADFGACLMAKPALVAECVQALLEAVPDTVTVSVKTRLGIDDLYSYEYFAEFVQRLYASGCQVFHVHARKAWLSGLSPRENREVPPLEYAWVYRLRRELPNAVIVINGGIVTVNEALSHVREVDGVMLGRAAYDNPYALAAIDAALFGASNDAPASRADCLHRYLAYVDDELAAGTELHHITRHLLTLFQGQAGGRRWRRELSENAHRPGAGREVIEHALAAMAAAAPAPDAA